MLHKEYIYISYIITNLFKILGDNCNLGTVSGKCRLIRDCPSAITALQNRGERPQICGFLETLPIVCCPSETSSNS